MYRFLNSLQKKINESPRKVLKFFLLIIHSCSIGLAIFCIIVSADGYYFLCVAFFLTWPCSYGFARSIEDPNDRNSSVSTLTHLYIHYECI